ncbi:hypothetical protein SYNPS1DRAFT_13679 [Syncephalis pseudoplumigaleata]|uniref:S1 motif domain-containing protein n=1 Tax=Syncephalis pseudoplumigaleata TaxID=1712513 RepID=A0A4P9Z5A0_9FUNG|nr:hypothetical protein SYNPS1DRAFT_13679 [Syncephalis pseudoplumigaleata]|eukprot:RKP26790.1 hypothetical protein SYNPS1DRAFT_13679 [Syncephalis pseudoplumigaleata]
MTAKKEVRKRQASDIADAAAPPSKKKAAKTKQAGASKDAPVAASTSTSTAATQDFPRGGGTGMTPIEYRSVVKQAERDLFGESKTKKPLTDEEYKDRKRKQRERRNVKKHKQAPLPASDKTNDDAEHDADDYTGPHHVTGLTFKRLATGTLLLGMISKISDLHLTVALPNNLTGRVAITEISTEITRRAEAAAEDEDDDEEDASSRGLPDLHAMFHIGQWVRCAVVGLEAGDDAQSTSNGTAKKSRKRIDLSLRVDQVNAGVVPIDLIPGFTLSATVTSLEDHGYLLDIGIADRTAFLPRKEAEAYTRQWHAGRPLQAGQPIIVTVMESSKKKAAAAQRVVHVTADPERTRQASVREALSNVQSLLPGEQVMARITRVLSNGLACRVLEFFDATIDIAHIPGMATIKQSGDHALRGQFKVGDKITARILYVSLSLAHKSIALTLLPHALSLERPGTATSTALGPDYGMVVDKAVVRRVENGVGLWCTMESMPDVPAFVHISRVADRHVQNLNASTWSPGTAHQARVVGFDPVDNVVQLSLQESVLSCPYLRIEDLPLGGKVKVTMKKLTAQGMVVDITDTPLSGFVPLVHLADVTLMKPEKKFKYGDHLVARVLATNPTDHKVFLTLKRSLVQSDLPVLTSYADATVGAFVQGYVTAVKPFGCMIGFYNSVRALCPLRELSETTLDNPQQHFQVGQPVRCRILSVDPAHERLRVSLRTHATIVQPEHKSKKNKKGKKQAKDAAAAASVDSMLSGEQSAIIELVKEDYLVVSAKDVAPGDLVSGYVRRLTEKGCFVTLGRGQFDAMVQIKDMSDKYVKDWKTLVKVGQLVQGRVLK